MPTQRRRRKHRGTQAGTVRRRGRTSRPGSRMEARQTAQQRRDERMNRPPSWRGAINRAGIAAAVFLAVLVLVLHQPAAAAVGLAAFMFFVYIPMGHAMDSFVYRLRQRRREREGEQ
jgi:Flp pilus assembly protein TadB